MDLSEAKRIIEALLFVFSHPLPQKRIREILPELEADDIRQVMNQLNEDYVGAGRAFAVQEVARGYQVLTDPALAPWIQKAFAHPKQDSVSTAALETLAIVAYRQPITKAEIEAIRGVDVTASLDTLVERRFVKIAGRKETPGRPFLYATTLEFLHHFGLKSLEALPTLQMPALQEPDAASPGGGQPAGGAPSTAAPAASETPAAPEQAQPVPVEPHGQ